MELSVVPYGQISLEAESNGRLGAGGFPSAKNMVRYRECLKNHAASMGGHANDGCGEFMADGEEGSIDALRCAACGCHRNFHRKEMSGSRPGWWDLRKKQAVHPHPAGIPPLPAPDPARESPDGCRKRYRTKFTVEQKEKMQAFAERLGWRIQKHDDVALQEFCMEVGVKRHVLKVWMHNNKHTLGKKQIMEEPLAPQPLTAV